MKWDYTCLVSVDRDTFMEDLRALGKQGWELVSVTPETDYAPETAYLKRSFPINVVKSL